MTASIGFVSVRHHCEHGYYGGYLIVNHLARPLEFHCTLPVKPSRAQEVLYGPTIDDFICGEQIAKALISKAKIKPDLVITDSVAALAVVHVSDCVAIKLDEALSLSKLGDDLRMPESQNRCVVPFTAKGSRFLRSSESHNAEAVAADVLSKVTDNFDISEPLSRIIDALMEAHPNTKAA